MNLPGHHLSPSLPPARPAPPPSLHQNPQPLPPEGVSVSGETAVSDDRRRRPPYLDSQPVMGDKKPRPLAHRRRRFLQSLESRIPNRNRRKAPIRRQTARLAMLQLRRREPLTRANGRQNPISGALKEWLEACSPKSEIY